MGESVSTLVRNRSDCRLRLAFHGAAIPSEAGLPSAGVLGEALWLTETTASHLDDSRTGRDVEHLLVALLRQAVYGRLAGYEDTCDARRLAPALLPSYPPLPIEDGDKWSCELGWMGGGVGE